MGSFPLRGWNVAAAMQSSGGRGEWSSGWWHAAASSRYECLRRASNRLMHQQRQRTMAIPHTMGSSPCRCRELRVSNSGKGGPFTTTTHASSDARAARAARRHPWSLLKQAHERRVISALDRRWARLVCFLCDQLPTALVKDLSVTGSVATTDRAGRSAGSFVEWPSGARLFACGMCWRSTLLTRVAKERVQRRVLGTHGGRRGWC
jgi:hypothetical protein